MSVDYGVVLDRISYDPGQHALSFDWPQGLAPNDVLAPRDEEIPQADVLVITWTSAEARALADVLTPGTQSTDWCYYKDNYVAYESQLTGRSPARDEGRLGSWASVMVGSKRAVCFKSELHPATDGPSLPTAQLVTQLAGQVKPSLIITTGTAGGAGNGTSLGDVNVAASVHSLFTTRLKDQPWSKAVWATTPVPSQHMSDAVHLAPQGKVPGETNGFAVWRGGTVSTDFFAFDTADDHFGLRAYDSDIRAVEMDDAAVAIGSGKASVPFASVRNASDPVMPDASEASSRKAEDIYREYGYWTTVNSALCTWALIAGL